MQHSFWDTSWRGSRRNRIFLFAVGILNSVFAATNIFYWSGAALVLADPISWATASQIGAVGHRPDLLEYPYVLLWTMPLAGSAVAMLTQFFGFRRVARVAALFPLALFGLTLCWWTIFQDTL